MAKKKKKPGPKKSHKKKSKGKAKARGRAPKKTGFHLDTIGKMIFSSAALRFGSGLAYWGLRKAGVNSPKIKIAVPVVAAVASAKGLLPHMEGFMPMAIDQAVNATIENVAFVKDIFDLKFMDKKPAAPTAGYTPRTAAETARLIAANNRNGYYIPRQGLYSRSGNMGLIEKSEMMNPSQIIRSKMSKRRGLYDFRRAA